MADSWESGRILYCYALKGGGKCTIMSNLNNISSSLFSCSLKVYKFAISDTTSTHFLTFPAFNGMQHTATSRILHCWDPPPQVKPTYASPGGQPAILKVEKWLHSVWFLVAVDAKQLVPESKVGDGGGF